MASYGSTIRQGLPRVAGGDPWPPAGLAPVEAAVPGNTVRDAVADLPAEVAPVAPVAERVDAVAGAAASTEVAARVAGSGAPVTAPAAARGVVAVRRGLPRVPGGEPWPPAEFAAALLAGQPAEADAPAPVQSAQPDAVAPVSTDAAGSSGGAATGPASSPTTAAATAATVSGGKALRRGLPRVAGGDPWPPAGFAPVAVPTGAAAEAAEPATAAPAKPAGRRTGLPRPGGAAAASTPPAPAPAAASTPPAPAGLAPLPFTSSVHAGQAAARWEADRARTIPTRTPITTPEPVRHGPFTAAQWAGAVIVTVIVLVGAVGMLVLLARWFLSVGFMQEFLAAYPGAYALPDSAPVGFPVWLNWQHFLNIFFMVLIIRSGLMVRYQKRPAAFWSPRWNQKRKISIQVWFHQSLDVLWLVNGVIFIVLLFTTGQWMRLVPTSWDVFPNALSAGLQYVSLDWPVEDGWINYNSLQQLAYFAVVFLAAPLAFVTGVRMSGIWPKNAAWLSKAYPAGLARAVHFPTMIFFVLFIIAHVTLVVTTGILHNLNAMFAANPGAGWIGFWFFAGAIIITAAGWVAARPLILAPIARLFGRVSER